MMIPPKFSFIEQLELNMKLSSVSIVFNEKTPEVQYTNQY